MTKLDFKTAFMYPFNRAIGLFNIFWIFVPIIGWFALWGYKVRIIQAFSNGDFKELPEFNFKENLGLWFFMFLKVIPFMIAFMVFAIVLWIIAWLIWLPELFMSLIIILISIFIIPMLFMNFMNKETVGSLFEFGILWKVFENIGDYIFSVLKDIVLAIVFVFMYIILVWIPAGTFTKNIFMADFYRRHIKNSTQTQAQVQTKTQKIEL